MTSYVPYYLRYCIQVKAEGYSKKTNDGVNPKHTLHNKNGTRQETVAVVSSVVI